MGTSQTLTRARDLTSWREFTEAIYDIEKEIAERSRETIGHYSRPLYRGQADANWRLVTTLERETKRDMTMARYHRDYIGAAHTLLAGFDEKQRVWEKDADCSYNALNYRAAPNYEFMGYLRHHGFPSPLLDWTTSPWVAAFFAFDNAYSSEKVSVYWFQEHLGKGKSTSSDKPRILTLGPYAAIHRRHFLQQSEYSICYEKRGEEAAFVSHEAAFTGDNWWPQDKVMKFTLPREIRDEAIFELNRMNINPYSLYQSEDALVKTIGNRLFTDGALREELAKIHIGLIRKEQSDALTAEEEEHD